ncbi:MAG: cytochrome c biogenesis heme-transporting ATPase CcmA [Gammaproteobacteria bacterium]|nr:cytochrome c biogenesis heme-transporting ATPase CcmA [Gammaproteobacteria bacterium]
MTASLTARSLCLFRGDRCLFNDLEFTLQEGEMLVVEGPNGSGKTSLLRAIAGLLDFESGVLAWKGDSVRDHYQVFRADLVWFAHRVGFKGDLDLLENLAFESGLRTNADASCEEVLERLGLDQVRHLPFRSLSAGQQRRGALARMLLSGAQIWIMDEPLTNLDKEGQALVIAVIEAHIKEGGLCLAASHQPLEIAGATRRVMLS